MSAEPVLGVTEPEGPVRGVALVLHGGQSKSVAPVRARQLAVLRMKPFATALQRAGAGDGLAVARLRYRARGWNGAQQSPVPDVQWALARLAERFPAAPIALVGHSMGGRAAMYAAGHPGVRAIVGLAPWLEPGDPVAQLAGRRVLIAHGALDRMTDPRASRAYARSAEGVAESVTYVSVAGERHAMLRRARLWHELTSGFVTGVLFDRPPSGTADPTMTNIEATGGADSFGAASPACIVSRALAGQAALVV